jgi:hypothetical protein
VVNSLNMLWLLYPQTTGPFARLLINLSLLDFAVVHRGEGFDSYLSTQ